MDISNGWHYHKATEEFRNYLDGVVIATVTREAWASYWIYKLHERGRVL